MTGLKSSINKYHDDVFCECKEKKSTQEYGKNPVNRF